MIELPFHRLDFYGISSTQQPEFISPTWGYVPTDVDRPFHSSHLPQVVDGSRSRGIPRTIGRHHGPCVVGERGGGCLMWTIRGSGAGLRMEYQGFPRIVIIKKLQLPVLRIGQIKTVSTL